MGQSNLKIGERVDERYELIERIGEGGHGRVYLAEQVHTGQQVAVKVLSSVDDSQLLARFDREMKLLAELSHPHLVNLIDSGIWERQRFLVLEFVEGEDLAHRMARGPLEAATAKRIMCQVLEATEVAHEKGVIHRDLKPENIMLTGSSERPVAKVLDFGIAKATGEFGEDWETLTLTEIGPGTPSYMAPELVVTEEGEESVRPSPQSDIYAAGLILLESLLGERVVTGDTPAEILLKQVENEIPIRPAIRDSQFGPIVERAVAKNREERYGNAGEMLRALEGISTPTVELEREEIAHQATAPRETPVRPPETGNGSEEGAEAGREQKDGDEQGVREHIDDEGEEKISTAVARELNQNVQAKWSIGAVAAALLAVAGWIGYRNVRQTESTVATPSSAASDAGARGAGFDSAADTYVTIQVESRPLGATVSSDGESLGKTPFEFRTNLDKSTRLLKFRKPGYKSKSVVLRVPDRTRKSAVTVEPKLRPASSADTGADSGPTEPKAGGGDASQTTPQEPPSTGVGSSPSEEAGSRPGPAESREEASGGSGGDRPSTSSTETESEHPSEPGGSDDTDEQSNDFRIEIQ